MCVSTCVCVCLKEREQKLFVAVCLQSVCACVLCSYIFTPVQYIYEFFFGESLSILRRSVFGLVLLL